MVCYVAKWADKYISERLSEYGMGMIEYAIVLTVNELF